MTLELRPNCECCDKYLPPDASDAMICSYECTFCADCVEARLPNSRVAIWFSAQSGRRTSSLKTHHPKNAS